MKAPFSINLRLLIFCTELQEGGKKKWRNVSVITVLCCQWLPTNERGTAHSHTSSSESQGLNMLICYWDANPVRLKRNAKHIAAVQMNNCFHRAAWVWRVAEGKVSLTFEPSCGGKGRLVSVSVWCSHSGKSRCGTKIRLGISQQIKSRSRNYFQHVPHIRAVNEECLWSTYWVINWKSNRSMWPFFSFTDALIKKKKKLGQNWLIVIEGMIVIHEGILKTPPTAIHTSRAWHTHTDTHTFGKAPNISHRCIWADWRQSEYV